MTKPGKNIFIALAFVSCLSIASCTQERQPCLTPTIASLNIFMRHYVAGSITPVDTALPSAVFVAQTASGYKGFVYGRQSFFAISLSPVADSAIWYIKTDTASKAFDTVTFYYSRVQHFVSNACGFSSYFNLQSVNTTHQFIDSIQILNYSVTNDVKTGNIQMFIHPGS